jgi:hypothetical protein
MFAWYKAKLEPSRHKTVKSDVPALEDVTKMLFISYAELEKILVSRYIKDLPQNDPWRHPYEHRLIQDQLRFARPSRAVTSTPAATQAGFSFATGLCGGGRADRSAGGRSFETGRGQPWRRRIVFGPVFRLLM